MNLMVLSLKNGNKQDIVIAIRDKTVKESEEIWDLGKDYSVLCMVDTGWMRLESFCPGPLLFCCWYRCLRDWMQCMLLHWQFWCIVISAYSLGMYRRDIRRIAHTIVIRRKSVNFFNVRNPMHSRERHIIFISVRSASRKSVCQEEKEGLQSVVNVVGQSL